MKNLHSLTKIFLLISLFFITGNLSAQTVLYTESVSGDLPNTNIGPVLTVDTPGTYVVQGTLRTPRDGQDWFYIQVGIGVQISNIAYSMTSITGGIKVGVFGPSATTPPATGNLSFAPDTVISSGTYSVELYTTASTGNPWSVTFTITPAPGPYIITQPTDQGICTVGDSVTFTSVGGGIPSPTVQWQESVDGIVWDNIPGATSPDYTFAPTALQIGNSYSAAYSNDGGITFVYTDGALLSLNTPTAVTTNPTDQSVTEGGVVNFTSDGSGSPVPTVQWQVSSDNGVSYTDLLNQTSTTLSFIANASDSNNLYRAIFTNPCATDTTSAARLSVAKTVLPVTLSFFDIKKSGSTAIIQWTTEQEENCKGFEIQHSLNGSNFERIAWIDGKGNSSAKHNYSYTHLKPYIGINFYRLKQVDYDGKETLSAIKAISFDQNISLNIFPNPVYDKVQIISSRAGMIRLMDLSGKIIKAQNMQNNLNLNLQNLASGVYIIQLVTGEGTESKKLIKR